VRQDWEGLPPHGDEVPELWGQTPDSGRQVPGNAGHHRDCPGQAKRQAHVETAQPTPPAATCSSGGSARLNWVPGGEPAETSSDWTEDVMEITATGMEPSGTAPPVAV